MKLRTKKNGLMVGLDCSAAEEHDGGEKGGEEGKVFCVRSRRRRNSGVREGGVKNDK